MLYKGVTRTVGAAFGTVAATGIVGLFGPRDPWAVALLFVVLALATWLRPLNYAYWAACVTAAFSLLYGYFGEADLDILGQRLQAIAVGAVISVAASWLIAPVRTVDVVRRRVADALAALADVLRAQDVQDLPGDGDGDGDGGGGGGDGQLLRHRARFDETVGLLDQIAPPLRTHRALVRRVRAGEPSPHLADAVDAVHACVEPVRTLTEQPERAGGAVGMGVGPARPRPCSPMSASSGVPSDGCQDPRTSRQRWRYGPSGRSMPPSGGSPRCSRPPWTARAPR